MQKEALPGRVPASLASRSRLGSGLPLGCGESLVPDPLGRSGSKCILPRHRRPVNAGLRAYEALQPANSSIRRLFSLIRIAARVTRRNHKLSTNEHRGCGQPPHVVCRLTPLSSLSATTSATWLRAASQRGRPASVGAQHTRQRPDIRLPPVKTMRLRRWRLACAAPCDGPPNLLTHRPSVSPWHPTLAPKVRRGKLFLRYRTPTPAPPAPPPAPAAAPGGTSRACKGAGRRPRAPPADGPRPRAARRR